MAPKVRALLLLPLLLLLSPVTAIDILEILKPLKDYSTFTQYLIEANLVDVINHSDNITVLAVKNSEMSPISSLPADVRKNVMSVHVLLGYYEPYSISHLHNKTSLVPTLFQATGLATNQNGYVKVTKKPIRQILFGSGVPGSPTDSYLTSVVGTNSDKLSVLHVSDPIIPPGIDGGKKTPAPASTPPAASSPTKQAAPAPASTPPVASSPTKQAAPAPTTAPPPASSPTTTHPAAPADAPQASAPIGDELGAPAASAGKLQTPPSSAGRVVVGATIGLAMGAVLLGVC